jgi:hypothetical protein
VAEIGKPERAEPWQVPVPSRETKPEKVPTTPAPIKEPVPS